MRVGVFVLTLGLTGLAIFSGAQAQQCGFNEIGDYVCNSPGGGGAQGPGQAGQAQRVNPNPRYALPPRPAPVTPNTDQWGHTSPPWIVNSSLGTIEIPEGVLTTEEAIRQNREFRARLAQELLTASVPGFANSPDLVVDGLTPPPQLNNPCIITNYLQNQTCSNGARVSVSRINGVPSVTIDGNGGDVCMMPHTVNGRPAPIDFSVRVRDFRNVRAVGLWVELDGDKTIRPGFVMRGQPRSQANQLGANAVIRFNDTRAGVGESIFVEGLHADGGGTDYIDIIASGNINWTQPNGNNRQQRYDNALDRIVLQNSRIVGVGTSHPDTHPDCWHMQARHLVKQVAIENFYGQTQFQCLQMNLTTMQDGDDVPFNPSQAFPTQGGQNLQPVYKLQNVVIDGSQGTGGVPIYINKDQNIGGPADYAQYGPRLVIPDWNAPNSGVHIAGRNRGIGQTAYGFGTQQRGGWTNNAPVSDGSGGNAFIHLHNNASQLPRHFADSPANVGPNYVSPWGGC